MGGGTSLFFFGIGSSILTSTPFVGCSFLALRGVEFVSSIPVSIISLFVEVRCAKVKLKIIFCCKNCCFFLLLLLTLKLSGFSWYKFIMHYAESNMKVLMKVIVRLRLKLKKKEKEVAAD